MILTRFFLIIMLLALNVNGLSEPMDDDLRAGDAITPDEMRQTNSVRDDAKVPNMDLDPILNQQRENEAVPYQGTIIQGDIVIPVNASGDADVQHNAIRNMNQRWTGGIVPYVIANSFSSNERLVIATAMKAYHDRTCVKFVPRTTQANYIYIMKGSGCYSSVGRTGGKQDVSLGNGCVYTGIAIHELMHAVGFWHEQSREDRDQFVTIHWRNIQPRMTSNFEKLTQLRISHLNEPYDTCSVMHYNAYAFSTNGQPTITRKSSSSSQSCELGQREGFSQIDLNKINKLYECSAGGGASGSGDKDGSESGNGKSDCVDISKHCSYWADKGECEKNPTWMLPNCPKACKQCDIRCKDLSKHCPRWAELGECEKNQPYMMAYCVDSCKCKTCKDMDKNCAYWAKAGYCKDKVYEEYMTLRCKKSCDICIP